MKPLFLFIVFTGLLACKNEINNTNSEAIQGKLMPLKYAKGFSVTDYGTHKILEIENPWPKSEVNYTYKLIKDKSVESTEIISIPVNKIVVTSTTHIPALDLLNMEHALVGFPGTDYISSETIRERIDEGHVRELGKNEGINTEVLLELNPEVVIAFGIDGNNKSFEIIKKSNIPVIYNGDWVEDSPLAKAEWIKFFGVLFNNTEAADSIFNDIEQNYLEAKKIASTVANRPSILSGALHRDIWYLPSGNSTEAQFLKDANVNYLWSDSKGKGSLTLNFESVFERAKQADIWLSPSNYPSLEALEKVNKHYTKFKAFQNKTIYSFTNTTGKTGGSLYFELGMTRPDLVLKDIIKICHPELLEDYKPFFFKPLQ